MKKLNNQFLACALPLIAVSCWNVDARGADQLLSSGLTADFEKPSWLTDVSLGLKESYDDSVFLSSVDPKYLPATYTVPAGSVAALENLGSWVTTISPKVGVNLAPLMKGQDTLQVLSLTYAPDFAMYHDQSSESYEAHRLATGIKGANGGLSFGLDDVFTYIHGSDFGPTYPGGFVAAYNTSVPRERREQIQDRSAVTLRYDWSKWFVRPTASLAYYDLMTEQINVTGYQSYEDRYDVNGGPDVGYKITPKIAATIGYRYGHQYQQQFSYSPYSSPSDYQRVLVGLEGRLGRWLDFKIQGGPDFRDYAGDTYDGATATHITPVSDKHMITYYGEAVLTATISPKDTLAFKYKQWQWVSSIGKVPYFDSTYDLSYHRKLTDKLSADLEGRLLTADYTSGDLATCKRDDWQYSVIVGLAYALNPHCNISVSYCVDLGRNAEDGVVDPATREYDHQLVSLATQFKF